MNSNIMNISKKLEECATEPSADQHINHLQNKVILKSYRPHSITCLEIEGIEGGQTSRVLEGTAGLI